MKCGDVLFVYECHPVVNPVVNHVKTKNDE